MVDASALEVVSVGQYRAFGSSASVLRRFEPVNLKLGFPEMFGSGVLLV